MAARSSIEAGLDLYDGGDFELAARRFDDASFHAHRAGDAELVRRATTAECMAWLRARRVEELAECSERLEDAQREARHPDPGVNTLISLGAVAGGRSLPSLRIPTSVRPIIRESAKESR